MEDLSKDVIVKILSNIAKNDVPDLFKASISCMRLRSLSETNEVFRNITQSGISSVEWRKFDESFLHFKEKVFDSGNNDVTYRMAMDWFWRKRNLMAAHELIDRIIDNSFVEAKYAKAIMLLFARESPEEIQLGINMLDEAYAMCSGHVEFIGFGNKLKETMNELWVGKDLKSKVLGSLCPINDHVFVHQRGFWSKDDEENPSCKACRAD